jgi:hypothetical protein
VWGRLDTSYFFAPINSNIPMLSKGSVVAEINRLQGEGEDTHRRASSEADKIGSKRR